MTLTFEMYQTSQPLRIKDRIMLVTRNGLSDKFLSQQEAMDALRAASERSELMPGERVSVEELEQIADEWGLIEID